jgi:hypothetical protein
MSGYREKEPFWRPPDDSFTLPYVAARIGSGLLPISFVLILSGSLIFSAIVALIGALLLAYGLRNY